MDGNNEIILMTNTQGGDDHVQHTLNDGTYEECRNGGAHQDGCTRAVVRRNGNVAKT